jgi:hypothetical protein
MCIMMENTISHLIQQFNTQKITTNYIQYNTQFVSKYINIPTNKICVTDARLAVLHGQRH